MFKSILLPIEGSEFSSSAGRLALEIAKQHQAHLSVMSIIDKPDIHKSLGPVPLGGLYYALQAEKKKLTDAEAEARKLVDEFTKKCKKAGITHHKIVREGEPVDVVSDEGKYHDMTVMGLRTLFKYNAKEDDNTLEGYLGRSEQPVIAVPKTYESINKILVAYDGSLPASRAVHSLMQFGLWQNRKLVLLNVNEDKDVGDLLLDRIGHFLESYGAQFEKVHQYGGPKEVILDYAVKHEFDFIVLGAHSKDKFSQFLFGSTTQHILDQTEVPLFIDH